MIKPDLNEPKHIDFGAKEEHEILHDENDADYLPFNLENKDECNVQIFFNSIYKGPDPHWFTNEYHLHKNGLWMARNTRIATVHVPLHRVKQWASQYRDKSIATVKSDTPRWKRLKEWPVRFIKEIETEHGWKLKLVLYIEPIDQMPLSVGDPDMERFVANGGRL